MKKNLSILLLAFLTFPSCNKDNTNALKLKGPSTTITNDEAKKFFNAEASQLGETRSLQLSIGKGAKPSGTNLTLHQFSGMIPDWTRSENSKFKSGKQYLAVPLLLPAGIKRRLSYYDTYKKVRSIYSLPNAVLIIQRDSSSPLKNFKMRIMQIEPDFDYYKSKNFTSVASNDFSGKVKMYSFSGELLNGLAYKRGSIIGYIKSKNATISSVSNAKGTIKADDDPGDGCIQEETCNWTQSCYYIDADYGYVLGIDIVGTTTYGENGDCGQPVQGGDITCGDWVFDSSTETTYCPPVGDGEIPPPTTGGGGGAPPGVAPLSAQVSALTSPGGNQLDGNGVANLNTVMSTIFAETCLTHALYAYLVAHNVKLQWVYVPPGGNVTTAGYFPATKNIGFIDDAAITFQTVQEELFHAYQDVYYAQSGGITPRTLVNVEFEAKFAQDLPNQYYGTPGHPLGNPTLDTSYNLWLIDLTQSPTGNPIWPNLNGTDGSLAKYFHYMGEFGTVSPYIGAPNESETPDALMELKQIACPGGPNDPYQ